MWINVLFSFFFSLSFQQWFLFKDMFVNIHKCDYYVSIFCSLVYFLHMYFLFFFSLVFFFLFICFFFCLLVFIALLIFLWFPVISRHLDWKKIVWSEIFINSKVLYFITSLGLLINFELLDQFWKKKQQQESSLENTSLFVQADISGLRVKK